MQDSYQGISSKPDRALRVQEVAELLAVSSSTVWRWTKEKKLVARRFGAGSTRWLLSDVARFMAGTAEGDQA